MVRPRWLSPQRVPPGRGWRHWDRFVALWASVNLLWVGFDLTYVPLRTFWLQRTLYPSPTRSSMTTRSWFRASPAAWKR